MSNFIKIRSILVFCIPIIAGILVSCGPAAQATPTPDQAAIFTQVAATIQAGIQQTRDTLPTSTPAPTNTLHPPRHHSNAPPLSLTPLPTLTRYVPISGGTQSSGSGDDLKMISDVNYPDCTVIAPGEEFTKTWLVQNSGTTTWTAKYFLQWIDIKNYDPNNYTKVVLTPKKVLGEEVKPDAQIELDVKLVSPDDNGVYTIYFRMWNPDAVYSKVPYGFGDQLWVKFVVSDGATTPMACTPGS